MVLKRVVAKSLASFMVSGNHFKISKQMIHVAALFEAPPKKKNLDVTLPLKPLTVEKKLYRTGPVQ